LLHFAGRCGADIAGFNVEGIAKSRRFCPGVRSPTADSVGCRTGCCTIWRAAWEAVVCWVEHVLSAAAEIRILDIRYAALCQFDHAKVEGLWHNGSALEYL